MNKLIVGIIALVATNFAVAAKGTPRNYTCAFGSVTQGEVTLEFPIGSEHMFETGNLYEAMLSSSNGDLSLQIRASDDGRVHGETIVQGFPDNLYLGVNLSPNASVERETAYIRCVAK